MDRITDIKVANIHFKRFWNFSRQAKHFDFSARNLKQSALLHALGFTPDHNRDHDLYLALHIDLIKVHMQESLSHRVSLQFLYHGRAAFGITVLNHQI